MSARLSDQPNVFVRLLTTIGLFVFAPVRNLGLQKSSVDASLVCKCRVSRERYQLPSGEVRGSMLDLGSCA